MDSRVGGGYRMSFTNFGTGKSHSFHGKYVELSQTRRSRYTDQFDDPNLPGEMQVTVALKPVACGPSCPSCRRHSAGDPRRVSATLAGRSR